MARRPGEPGSTGARCVPHARTPNVIPRLSLSLVPFALPEPRPALLRRPLPPTPVRRLADWAGSQRLRGGGGFPYGTRTYACTCILQSPGRNA